MAYTNRKESAKPAYQCSLSRVYPFGIYGVQSRNLGSGLNAKEKKRERKKIAECAKSLDHRYLGSVIFAF